MPVKGVDKLRAKLPKYMGWRWVGLGLLVVMGFVTVFTLMLLTDSMARICPYTSFLVLIEPILPILGVLICELIAFRLLWGMWHNRDRYVAELGELAYQKAIPRGLFGISWVFAICLHIYVPLDALPAGTPVNPVTAFLARSLLAFLGIPIEFDSIIRIVGSVVLLILGALTVRSAVLTFGVDYMTLVYLYYPNESEVQQHAIYSVIRHPTYFGVLVIAAGGMWLRFSVYSLVFFVAFLLGLMTHIFVVEEKELRERFGEPFIEYQKRVPALHVRIRDLRTYLRFLVMRGAE